MIMEFKLNFLISFLYKIEKFINKHKKKTIAIFLIVLYQMIYTISPFFGKTNINISVENENLDKKYIIVFKKADNFELCKQGYDSAWIEGNNQYSDYLLSFNCDINYNDLKKSHSSFFGFYYSMINIDDIVPNNTEYYELEKYYDKIFQKIDTIPEEDWQYQNIDLSHKIQHTKHQKPIGYRKPIYFGIYAFPIGIPNPFNVDKLWEYKIDIQSIKCSSICGQENKILVINHQETLSWAQPYTNPWS